MSTVNSGVRLAVLAGAATTALYTNAVEAYPSSPATERAEQISADAFLREAAAGTSLSAGAKTLSRATGPLASKSVSLTLGGIIFPWWP